MAEAALAVHPSLEGPAGLQLERDKAVAVPQRNGPATDDEFRGISIRQGEQHQGIALALEPQAIAVGDIVIADPQ